jgi:hypothetical protein
MGKTNEISPLQFVKRVEYTRNCLPHVYVYCSLGTRNWNFSFFTCNGFRVGCKNYNKEDYDYEHFFPGGTNNLHFADIQHPFLITSRYTRLARRQAKTDHYRKSSIL